MKYHNVIPAMINRRIKDIYYNKKEAKWEGYYEDLCNKLSCCDPNEMVDKNIIELGKYKVIFIAFLRFYLTR